MKAVRAILLTVSIMSMQTMFEVRGADISTHKIRFPVDTAMHPSASTEWWYFVGHLSAQSGHQFGYESTLFKFSGLRRYFSGSPVDTAYRTDVAITDEHAQRYLQRVSYVPSLPQVTEASTKMLSLRAGLLQIHEVGSLSYHIIGKTTGGSVDLVATSIRSPMLVEGGYQQFGTGYTYYYSLTEMHTTGWITVGHSRIAVSGTSWMDHQWGNWDWSTIIGWDWMSMQLSDHSNISVDNERTTVGNPRWAMELSPTNKQLFVPDVRVTVLGTWKSRSTGVSYPSGWRVQVSKLKLDVTIRPTVRNQEIIDTFGVDHRSSTYWEGSCTVTGTRDGHQVNGKAYVELTGYGNRLSTIH